jgi:hypothetical protein
MAPRFLKLGSVLAGIAGVLLVGFMFGLDWFTLGPGEGEEVGSLNAWQAFGGLDLLLLVAGLLGAALAVRSRLGSSQEGDLGMLAAITGAVAVGATAVLALRVANPPDLDTVVGAAELHRAGGAYLGLAAAAGTALGACLSLAAIRPTRSPVGSQPGTTSP